MTALDDAIQTGCVICREGKWRCTADVECDVDEVVKAALRHLASHVTEAQVDAMVKSAKEAMGIVGRPEYNHIAVLLPMVVHAALAAYWAEVTKRTEVIFSLNQAAMTTSGHGRKPMSEDASGLSFKEIMDKALLASGKVIARGYTEDEIEGICREAFAAGKRAGALKALQIAVEGLEFYADPETYFAIAFLGDPPCGPFAEDFSDDHGHPNLDGDRMGKQARVTLRALCEKFPDFFDDDYPFKGLVDASSSTSSK